MTTARIFKSGNSQAVRLPKEFRFRTQEVEIFHRGDEVVLREKATSVGQKLDELFKNLPPMPEDFFGNGRDDVPPQDRESF